MNKVISLLVVISVVFYSCKKNCQDCGPTSSATYYLKNSSGSNLKLIFYGDSTTINSVDSINISNNDRVAFLYAMTGSPVQSTLSFKYYLCDSIKIFDNAGLKSIFKNLKDCNNLNNLMCTSIYTLTKLDEVKKGKNKGDKYSEYEFVLK